MSVLTVYSDSGFVTKSYKIVYTRFKIFNSHMCVTHRILLMRGVHTDIIMFVVERCVLIQIYFVSEFVKLLIKIITSP